MALAPALKAAEFPRDMPVKVAVVVDTEEAFDWAAPFSRWSRDVSAMAHQDLAQRIFDRHGVVPTYVMDYPIAADAHATDILRGYFQTNRACIGTHLQPWVSPPYDEEVNFHNSYHGNLPAALEREKILRLTELITDTFGTDPQVFKAGRYGLGPNTLSSIAECGYTIDCSVVPHSSYAEDGGPTFYGLPDQPYWSTGGIFEVPLTRGYIGRFPRLGELVPHWFDRQNSILRLLPGALSRLGVLERSTLTPEGVSLSEQMRLVNSLIARGRKVLVLTYHSSTLGIGGTPYVSSEAEREAFLETIDGMLGWLQATCHCEFTTLSALRDLAITTAPQISRPAPGPLDPVKPL